MYYTILHHVILVPKRAQVPARRPPAGDPSSRAPSWARRINDISSANDATDNTDNTNTMHTYG